MRIVLDQDQILAKFTERALEWWNEDHPDDPKKLSDIVSWDIDGCLGTEYFLRSIMRYPEFYRDLEPVEGAIDGVEKLIKKGHDVVIASAAPVSATCSYTGKVEWIRRNMPFFDVKNNFFIAPRKDVLDGDVLFDDALHNIVPWLTSQVPRFAVIKNCPWNRYPDSSSDANILNAAKKGNTLWRVDSWKEFMELVESWEIPF